jgi:hypothetical protein
MTTLAILTSSFVAVFLNAQVPAAECLTQYGTTQCGYGCVAAYGQVQCSPNPGGACAAEYGRVVCSSARVSITTAGYEQAQCVAAYGQLVCGYGCAQAYGQVRCSQVPGGICSAAYGSIQCVEAPQRFSWAGPAHAAWGAANVTGAFPQAECLRRYGTTACGYDCKAFYGQVRCAQTPLGRCIAERGQVRCVDPR